MSVLHAAVPRLREHHKLTLPVSRGEARTARCLYRLFRHSGVPDARARRYTIDAILAVTPIDPDNGWA